MAERVYEDKNDFIIVGEWSFLPNENKMNEHYYWIDTDYHYSDFHVQKWALFQGELTEDGEKDYYSERVVVWGEIPDTDDDDKAWRLIDDAIESELGFLPDYEVN